MKYANLNLLLAGLRLLAAALYLFVYGEDSFFVPTIIKPNRPMRQVIFPPYRKYGYDYPVYRNMDVVYKNTLIVAHLLHSVHPNWVLVCRGSSGLTIATTLHSHCKLLYERMSIRIHYIRKTEETSHDRNYPFELKGDEKVLIVDDFIGTGYTMITILSHIPKKIPISIFVIGVSRLFDSSIFPHLAKVASEYIIEDMIDPTRADEIFPHPKYPHIGVIDVLQLENPIEPKYEHHRYLPQPA